MSVELVIDSPVSESSLETIVRCQESATSFASNLPFLSPDSNSLLACRAASACVREVR